MLKAEQVPQAVKDAFYNAYWREDATDEEAIAAAINAWPGMGTVATEDHAGVWRQIILPLPQESGE